MRKATSLLRTTIPAYLPWTLWAGMSLILPLASKAGAQAATAAPTNLSVSPTTTYRGTLLHLLVPQSIVRAREAKVFVDGVSLEASAASASDPQDFTFLIPLQPDPLAADFLPLGEHHVTAVIAGRLYDNGAHFELTRPEPLRPVLLSVSPETINAGGSGFDLVITGSGFLDKPAADNVVWLDGTAQPVVWTGCPAAATETPRLKSLPHGEVQAAGTRIVLCNLPPLQGLRTSLSVHQGAVASKALPLFQSAMTKRSVVLWSVGVNLAGLLVILFFSLFVPRVRIAGHTYGTLRVLFLDPKTNTYSLSNYQFYVWTSAAIFTYAYFAISKVFVQGMALPDVPSTLPALVGFGAGTAVAARLLTSFHGSKGGGQEAPGLGDFITSGGVAAPDRVQMFLWTNLGATAFCLTTLRAAPWTIEGLPHLGGGLLSLMGLSAATYLGGKYARKPGPVLQEISFSSTQAPAAGLPQPPVAPTNAEQEATSLLASVPGLLGELLPGSPAASAAGALRAALAAVQTAAPGADALLRTHGATAAEAAEQAAQEFVAALHARPGETDQKGRAAAFAQQAAAATQDLQRAQSRPSAESDVASVQVPGVTLLLRGQNLSPAAIFQVDDVPLPSRMLASVQSLRVPESVVPSGATAVILAAGLSLTIDPSRLVPTDATLLQDWLKPSSEPLVFRIINPDGQRSELAFSVPPAVAQPGDKSANA